MNKPNKHVATENRLVVTRGEVGGRKGKMSKGSQLCGDGWKLNFWW